MNSNQKDRVQGNNNSMTKEELLHMAEELRKQAFMMNSYHSLIKQYTKNSHDFLESMNCSPAFYQVSHNALKESLLLNLARLYDCHPKAVTIDKLLQCMNRFSEPYLYESVKDNYDRFGELSHHLKKDEEVFYPKEVAEQKQICSIFDIKYSFTSVSLTYRDLLNLYNKRLRSIKADKILKRLSEQRDKIIAHNDEVVNFNYVELQEDFPLPWDDICRLVDFAVDFTQFSVSVLTGTTKGMLAANHDDWTMTLQLVQEGKEQRERERNRLFGFEEA